MARLGMALMLVLALFLALGACRSPFSDPVPEGCYVGRLTDEGEVCQTLRGEDGTIYSFFEDMNGYSLGEEVCVCGEAAAMTRCKTGQPLDLVHLDRECPGPPSAY